MSRLRRAALVGLFVLFAQPAWRALAQAQGAAVITAPLEGAGVAGLVPIAGAAVHPQFVRYELAFAYDPNPTDSWFSIQDPVASPVSNDLLGAWDTTGITDGTYVLRLRVYWSETDFLEAFVRRVEVRNAAPTASPTAGESAASLSLTASPPPAGATQPAAGAGTQPVIVLPPPATPRPTPGPGSPAAGRPTPSFNGAAVQRAFYNGIGSAIFTFGLLGAYAAFRHYRRTHPRR